MKKLARVLAVCGFATVTMTTASYSLVITFTGNDPGASPGSPTPNSSAAAASFDASAGALGGVNLVTFESLPLGQFSSLSLTEGVTATQINYDPSLGGIVPNGYAGGSSPAAVGFNTTPGGAKFLGFVPTFNIGTARLDFSFSTPIQAWGAYVVGLEAAIAGIVTVQFDDGTANSFQLADTTPAGVQFFGFTDSHRSIVAVSLVETGISGSRDIYGVDDMRYVLIPEPSTFVLAGLGALGLMAIVRRKK